MQRRGWDVTLLAGSLEHDPDPGHTRVDDVDVVRYRIPRGRFGTGRSTHAEAAAMAAVAGNRLSGHWDVVHGHAPTSALAIGELVPRDRARRCVYTLHSPASRELAANTSADGWAHTMKRRAGGWLLDKSERHALEHADAIHVLSRYSARLVEEVHGPAAASKVTRIPWFVEGGIDSDVESGADPALDREDARRRLGWQVDGFHAITVRRLVPRMGVDTLVRANALLPEDSKIWMHVIGEGSQRASLEQLARTLSGSRSSALTFDGRLSDAGVEAAYAAADLFVVPTAALEGFGLIILEALARGVPVIGTDVGAIPEVLGRIDPEAIVPAGDAAALARKIVTLASRGVKPETRAALARRTREAFPTRLTLDTYQAFLAGSVSAPAGATS